MNKFPDLSIFDRFSFDTETDGLVYKKNKAFGFSISLPNGVDIYHDIRETPQAIDWINSEISRFKGTIICHNASFDHKMSEESGIYIPIEKMDCTVIRACLLNEHELSYSLDELAFKYLKERKESEIYEVLAKLFGGRQTRNVQMKNISLAPSNVVAPYACKDTRLTLKLWDYQKDQIDQNNLHNIVDFERRVMVPIIETSKKGIRVDTKEAEIAVSKLTTVIDKYQKQINDLTGVNLNVNSPKQIKEVFNPKYKDGNWVTDSGYVLGVTDKGNPSIDADSLRSMENDPRANLILKIRSHIKTRDTFLCSHVLGHEIGGRVYPNINQNKGEDGGTGTGRLSYSEPAMQQIPSRDKEVASIVKPVFLPEEGHEWMSLDQHSFEVRVFAHLVNNEVILKKYRDNPKSDFHQMVSDLTGLVRNATYPGQPNSKQLNLSMIFNSGNGAIADKMGMPWEWESFLPKGKADVKENYVTYKKAGPEACEVIERYHRALPGVKELAKNAENIAKQFGYVQTKTGRRLRFPNGYKAYKASGLAIQATAADINKQMWLDTYDIGECRLLLNTHDSYEISKPVYVNSDELRKDIQDRITKSVPWFKVPLILELNGTGANWWQAVKKEK